MAVAIKGVVVLKIASRNVASRQSLVRVAATCTLTSANVRTSSHLAVTAAAHQRTAVRRQTAVATTDAARTLVPLQPPAVTKAVVSTKAVASTKVAAATKVDAARTHVVLQPGAVATTTDVAAKVVAKTTAAKLLS